MLQDQCFSFSLFISQSGEVLLQKTQFALQKYILPSKMVRTCHQKIAVRYLVPPVPPLENQFTHLPSLYVMVCLTIMKHVILIHPNRFWTCKENEPHHLASTLFIYFSWCTYCWASVFFFFFEKDNGTPNLTSTWHPPVKLVGWEQVFSSIE